MSLRAIVTEIFQVDAFTDEVFKGNPAAICPLRETLVWPNTPLLQAIAMENNLAATAFFKPSSVVGAHYDLRWFSPSCEVELCGHATLASAFVLFNYLGHAGNSISFATLSGILTVTRSINPGLTTPRLLTMDLPARPVEACPTPAGLVECLGAAPEEVYRTTHGVLLCIFKNESEIRGLKPNFDRMLPLDHCILITAPGDRSDFVSRFFAPHKGVNEDAVTGSAHCILTPFWAKKLNQSELSAIQVSPRGGQLHCRMNGARVFVSGEAVLFFHGFIC